MYAVYRQAHPPTGLEFSMYCNFFNNTEKNLVVAGTSQLYVYRLNHHAESSSKSERGSEVKGHKEKLELMASFSFFGNVMSMASVQLAGAKRDALLLSFKEAKLSVVEYDPEIHDLKTLSLHYFEEPELRVGGMSSEAGFCSLRVPSSMFYICVLPVIASHDFLHMRCLFAPPIRGCYWVRKVGP
ncbi:cleavage and polyadenylation specificity factor subunit 1-like [Lithobates pipiens]